MIFQLYLETSISATQLFVLVPSSYITFQVDALYVQDVVAVSFAGFFVVRCFGGFCVIFQYGNSGHALVVAAWHHFEV